MARGNRLLAADCAETRLEALDTSASVQNLLLTGVERVAGGANVQVDRGAQGGTGSDYRAAAAGRFDCFVVRMHISFHEKVLGWFVPPPDQPDRAPHAVAVYRTVPV